MFENAPESITRLFGGELVILGNNYVYFIWIITLRTVFVNNEKLDNIRDWVTKDCRI